MEGWEEALEKKKETFVTGDTVIQCHPLLKKARRRFGGPENGMMLATGSSVWARAVVGE